MKKEFIVEDYGVRLRPVRVEDASFIVALRNAPHVKGKMGDVPDDVILQEKWIINNMNKDDDYYFIIESPSGIRQGTIGVYDIRDGIAETGRIAVINNSLAALPACILFYNIVFDILKIEETLTCIESNNSKVISMNLRFGYIQKSIDQTVHTFNAQKIKLIYFSLTAKQWHFNRNPLMCIAQKMALHQMK